jgi:hypothetical protein
MDYQKIYYKLVLKAKNRQEVAGYFETHHIIPRCLQGTDDSNNLVKLTAKEHFLAHLLLVEIYPTNQKLRYALWMMASMKTGNQQRYKVSARTYQRIKESLNKKTDEHKKKISESLKKAYAEGSRKTNKGKKMPATVGKKISEAKKGMVGTNLGKPMSEEQKKKIAETLKGHSVSEETRKKISAALKVRKSLNL